MRHFRFPQYPIRLPMAAVLGLILSLAPGQAAAQSQWTPLNPTLTIALQADWVDFNFEGASTEAFDTARTVDCAAPLMSAEQRAKRGEELASMEAFVPAMAGAKGNLAFLPFGRGGRHIIAERMPHENQKDYVTLSLAEELLVTGNSNRVFIAASYKRVWDGESFVPTDIMTPSYFLVELFNLPDGTLSAAMRFPLDAHGGDTGRSRWYLRCGDLKQEIDDAG